MDPLSVTWAALSILAVSSKVLQITNKVTNFEGAKIDQVHYRLLAERERTKEWANKLVISDGTDLQKQIPTNELERVVILLEKLDMYCERAVSKFERFFPASLQHSSKRPRYWIAKWIFLSGGFEDLKDVIDTMHAMNDVLALIAPPLPPYLDAIAPRTAAAPALPEEVAPASASQPREYFENKTEDRNALVQPNHEWEGPSLRDIHLKIMAAFFFINQERPEDPKPRRAAARLSLWAAGLFNDRLSLDEIIGFQSVAYSSLRQTLIAAFARIMVEEGQSTVCPSASPVLTGSKEEYLKHIYRETGDQSCQSIRNELVAYLGLGDLSEVAFEQKKNHLEQLEMSNANEFARGKSDGVTSARHMKITPAIIESLFDLLPSIRSMRRIVCLRLEAEENLNVPVDTKAKAPIRAPTKDTASPESIGNILDSAIHVVREYDSANNKKNGRSEAKLRWPQMVEEKQNLEKIYESRGTSLSRGLSKDESPRTLKKEAELRSKIGRSFASRRMCTASDLLTMQQPLAQTI